METFKYNINNIRDQRECCVLFTQSWYQACDFELRIANFKLYSNLVSWIYWKYCTQIHYYIDAGNAITNHSSLEFVYFIYIILFIEKPALYKAPIFFASFISCYPFKVTTLHWPYRHKHLLSLSSGILLYYFMWNFHKLLLFSKNMGAFKAIIYWRLLICHIFSVGLY